MSFVPLPLIIFPPVVYTTARIAFTPWTLDHGYFLPGTHPFSPFPLAYSITHKMKPFMIWPSLTYSVLSSLLHTSKAIFSSWFVFLLLNYMENSTVHHNVHFHWEVFLGPRDRFSSALTDSSLRWPPEIPASWYLCLPEFFSEFRQNQWWLVSN